LGQVLPSGKWRHDDEDDRILATAVVCFAANFDAGLCAGDLGRNTEKHRQLLVDAARNTARVATLNPVTVNMCWASDRTSLVADPAVVAGFQKITRKREGDDQLPGDSSGYAARLRRIMNQWESGKLNCSTVSPDASILGLRSAKWNAAEQTMYASSMVIGVVNPRRPKSRKFYNKDPKALTFLDLIAVAGKNWADLAPGNTRVANWGTVKGTPPTARVRQPPGGCRSARVLCLRPGEHDRRELSNPKVKSVITRSVKGRPHGRARRADDAEVLREPCGMRLLLYLRVKDLDVESRSQARRPLQ